MGHEVYMSHVRSRSSTSEMGGRKRSATGMRTLRSAVAVVVLALALSKPSAGAALGSWSALSPVSEIRGAWDSGRMHLAKARDEVASAAVGFPAFDPSGLIAGVKELVTGGVAGGIGSFIVFPIDLAKTRIQDQRAVAGAEVMYKNVVQTIAKVATSEGVPSLYKGVAPVLIGAAPEGALQIGVNNIVRQSFADKLKVPEADIPVPLEFVAGGCGGAAQIIVSTPMERVKILQQIMGKKAASVGQIVKQVGLRGIYTGWNACLARDVFFGAFYFPLYNNVKKALTKTDVPGQYREATVFDALGAGLVAGVVAAGSTCPFDVIKTRMQSVGAEGHSASLGFRAAATELWAEGGASALFKGFTGRVGRVAPQLAICLAIVEAIKRIPGFAPEPAKA